jgi:hypothetical protein
VRTTINILIEYQHLCSRLSTYSSSILVRVRMSPLSTPTIYTSVTTVNMLIDYQHHAHHCQHQLSTPVLTTVKILIDSHTNTCAHHYQHTRRVYSSVSACHHYQHQLSTPVLTTVKILIDSHTNTCAHHHQHTHRSTSILVRVRMPLAPATYPPTCFQPAPTGSSVRSASQVWGASCYVPPGMCVW